MADVGETPQGELVGRKLGAYRIEALLGEGAMGEVYRGVHESLARPVAVKALKAQVAADRSLLERFFAEARAVNIIRHENIVECTDMVHDPSGQSYLVMELLEGRSLGDAIREARRMPPARAVAIAAQIADAIAAAHDKGIIHRDLKPENVFLIRRAATADYVKVLDFGIARLRPDMGAVSATQSGALVGTPAYMSPEQARGDRATSASDLYALGVIVFHMVAGRLPFMAATLPLMLIAHISEPPPRLDEVAPQCPKALADVVARALAKDTAARPADLRRFRAELLASVGIADAQATADTLAPPASGADLALGATLASGAGPAGGAGPLPATVARSSLSGGAAELVAKSPPTRGRAPLLVGGALALLAAGGVVASGRLGGGPSSPPPAAPAAAPVSPAAPAAVPPAPPAADRAAAVLAEAPDAGPPAAAAAPPPAASPAEPVRKRDRGRTTRAQTAEPATPAPPPAEPPPPKPAEPDRTRQIIR